MTYFFMASAEEREAIAWYGTVPVELWYVGRSVKHSDLLRLQAIVTGSPLPEYVEEPPRTLLGLEVDPGEAVFRFPADLVRGLAEADPMKLHPWARIWVESIPPRDDEFNFERMSYLVHELHHLAWLAVQSGRDMYMYLSDKPPFERWPAAPHVEPEAPRRPATQPIPSRRPEMKRLEAALIERVSVRGAQRKPAQREEALVGVEGKS
jgi:hypothetical protein